MNSEKDNIIDVSLFDMLCEDEVCDLEEHCVSELRILMGGILVSSDRSLSFREQYT